MTGLSRQRCHNHPGREAAAVCLECRRTFCRECVTEHEDRVLCASCLKKLTAGQKRRGIRLGGLLHVLRAAAGFLVIWLFFLYLGEFLLSIPTQFHDGTVWQKGFLDEE